MLALAAQQCRIIQNHLGSFCTEEHGHWLLETTIKPEHNCLSKEAHYHKCLVTHLGVGAGGFEWKQDGVPRGDCAGLGTVATWKISSAADVCQEGAPPSKTISKWKSGIGYIWSSIRVRPGSVLLVKAFWRRKRRGHLCWKRCRFVTLFPACKQAFRQHCSTCAHWIRTETFVIGKMEKHWAQSMTFGSGFTVMKRKCVWRGNGLWAQLIAGASVMWKWNFGRSCRETRIYGNIEI